MAEEGQARQQIELEAGEVAAAEAAPAAELPLVDEVQKESWVRSRMRRMRGIILRPGGILLGGILQLSTKLKVPLAECAALSARAAAGCNADFVTARTASATITRA